MQNYGIGQLIMIFLEMKLLGIEYKCNVNYKNRLELIYRPTTLFKKKGYSSRVPLRKESGTLPKICTVTLSPSLAQRDPFIMFTVHWGKENNQTIRGVLDTDSDIILISNPKTSLWFSSQGRGFWRSDDQWSFSSSPSHSGPSGSAKPSCGYFPSSEMHTNQKKCTQPLEESSHWNPNLWNEGIVEGKANCKPLELFRPRKIVN